MKYRAKRLITIKRGENVYVITVRDLALIIYMALIVTVIVLGFILLYADKIQAAQGLFTFFSGIGLAEVIEKLRRWKEPYEEDED
ncbi:MAG: hypothetical protein ACXQTR_05700 [Candidatus Methanospirareceae archaeon]